MTRGCAAKAPQLGAALRPRAAHSAGSRSMPTTGRCAAHRAPAARTCGVRDGRLLLQPRAAREHDLGAWPHAAHRRVAAPPTTSPTSPAPRSRRRRSACRRPTIAAVFARFGASAADNLGRMMRFERDGVRDPRRLCAQRGGPARAARGRRAPARRRGPARHCCSAMPATARTPRSRRWRASPREFHPELVVVKENEAHLRGRAARGDPAHHPRGAADARGCPRRRCRCA